jgi:hypothetical protein
MPRATRHHAAGKLLEAHALGVIARDSARIVGRALQRRLSGTFWWSRGEDRFASPKST